MCAVAYSGIKRRNDVARAFEMKAETVGDYRLMVAACYGHETDCKLYACAEHFNQTPQNFFVSGMSADATKEYLQLPMIGPLAFVSCSIRLH